MSRGLRPTNSPALDPTDHASLSVESVSFSYGQAQVLFDIDLTVQPGEAVALVGTNGAGKSTLLRVVAGLERATSGRVTLGQRDLTTLDAEARISTGLLLISGGRAVFPELTVSENLDMLAFSLRRDRHQARAAREGALDRFPALRSRLHQRAGSLSGGEQQQLGLTQALMLRPRVLCIDEVSLGLAPVVVAELLTVIAELHAAGTTLVLVEQSLNVAASLCDRAVFLEKGAVRFDGSIHDLIERPDLARSVFFGPQQAPAPAAS